MLHWSHFLFRLQLKMKAEENNCTIHEVSEHYTSKTCGVCSKVHWKLGKEKIFKCPSCQFTID